MSDLVRFFFLCNQGLNTLLLVPHKAMLGIMGGGGGPTTFLYMATRFLANVHVQNVQKLFFPVWKFPGKIYLLWLIHNDRYITWECI